MPSADPTLERVVHATSPNGAELVRYDKAGKWYVESPLGSLIPARHVSIREAALVAVTWEELGGTVPVQQYGGSRLHTEIRKIYEEGA
jgi:hypothetical protein